MIECKQKAKKKVSLNLKYWGSVNDFIVAKLSNVYPTVTGITKF